MRYFFLGKMKIIDFLNSDFWKLLRPRSKWKWFVLKYYWREIDPLAIAFIVLELCCDLFRPCPPYCGGCWRPKNIISRLTLWNINSTFCPSLSDSSAYQRFTKKFYQLWLSASISRILEPSLQGLISSMYIINTKY